MRLHYYDPTEWSLKCVLLHIGNEYIAVPTGHSPTLKEEYGTIKTVLDLTKYDEHNWYICVDPKMVNFLLGQQFGFTKYLYYLCLWDSRDRKKS